MKRQGTCLASILSHKNKALQEDEARPFCLVVLSFQSRPLYVIDETIYLLFIL